MNDQTPPAADASELQFNEAEYAVPAATGATCQACRRAIPDQYYQVNGAVLCESCSTQIKNLMTGGATFPRVLKASFYGLGASFVGFLIYFGILKLTGLEVGLISILVGYMVGAAVKNGSGGRGGPLFQAIAVSCTYLAIAASYSALFIPQMIAQLKDDDAAAVQPQEAAKPGDAGNAVDAQPQNAAGLDAKSTKGEEAAPRSKISAVEFVFALAMVAGFLLALPILVGFTQPIGLLIVGFALWEAFKLTRKVELVITGPHNVGQTPVAVPANA